MLSIIFCRAPLLRRAVSYDYFQLAIKLKPLNGVNVNTSHRTNKASLEIDTSVARLITCVPAFAQNTGGLGGSVNDAESGEITHIIMDRVTRRRMERKSGVKPAS